MTRHEEIYLRYINGETDMCKLGKDYGVTRERIRQIVEKQERLNHRLKTPINEISICQNKLKDYAKELIGNVDNNTLCEYNDIIKQMDAMMDKLKELDDITAKIIKEKSEG